MQKFWKNIPELYAPPGGTGLAARRHLRKLEFYALRELLGNVGSWKSVGLCYFGNWKW